MYRCLLSLFLFSTATASSTTAGGTSTCQVVRSTTQVQEATFFPLPEETSDVIFVPFSFTPTERTSQLSVYLAPSRDLQKDYTLCTISISRTRVIVKAERGNNRENILKKARVTQRWYINATTSYLLELASGGLDKVLLKLYHVSETNTALVFAYKAKGFPYESLGYYSFVSTGASPVAEVYHRCKTPDLGDVCRHFADCAHLGEGAVCIREEEYESSEAECKCGEGFMDSGGVCVRIDHVAVGGECVSSYQCHWAEAKCRTISRGKKVCACFPDQELNMFGICEVKRNKLGLDMTSMNNRPQLWAALNPGRPRRPDGLVGEVSQLTFSRGPGKGSTDVHRYCAVHQHLEGMLDFPHPTFPRQYFPLSLNKNGFELGLFVKGQGVLLLQFSHNGEVDKDNKLFVQLEVTDATIGVSGDQETVGILKVALQPSVFDADDWSTLRISLACRHGQSWCDLTVGNPNGNILAVPVHDPWTLSPYLPNWSPSHFSFLPGSKSTWLEVMAECRAAFNQRCSHHRDCRKTYAGLVCSSQARCVCSQQGTTWNNEQNRCE